MYEDAAGGTPKAKTNSLRQTLNQHKGTKVDITNQAIEKVRLIKIKGLTEKNNIAIQEAHKGILKFAKEENNSNEVAGIVNLVTGDRTELVKGNRNEVDIYSSTEIYHLLRISGANSLVLCHNHPGLTNFSANDISIFMRHDSIKTMTIVTNRGKVKCISKNDNFQRHRAAKLMKECLNENHNDIGKSIEEFLKRCYSAGIERQQ